MSGRTGERVLAALFGLFGLGFAVEARELAYMDEFVPGAGFVPFWLGLVLLALVVGFLLTTRAPAAPSYAGPVSARKVAAVAAGLGVCIAVIGRLGFAVSLAAYLFYLVRGVERRGWGTSAAVALGATAGLYVVFHVWLRVPLPRGPWGF